MAFKLTIKCCGAIIVTNIKPGIYQGGIYFHCSEPVQTLYSEFTFNLINGILRLEKGIINA